MTIFEAKIYDDEGDTLYLKATFVEDHFEDLEAFNCLKEPVPVTGLLKIEALNALWDALRAAKEHSQELKGEE